MNGKWLVHVVLMGWWLLRRFDDFGNVSIFVYVLKLALSCNRKSAHALLSRSCVIRVWSLHYLPVQKHLLISWVSHWIGKNLWKLCFWSRWLFCYRFCLVYSYMATVDYLMLPIYKNYRRILRRIKRTTWSLRTMVVMIHNDMFWSVLTLNYMIVRSLLLLVC